ncbi:hypothetical protein M378DRAFT_173576 [Amanita muscaria Koide BX008]|uniref:Uncharacterized protein n=1 Tax=Amanita muscaria (strain Koide BX008) TaxID=946122 RepID=A0A0C2RYV5_AMAMK|nr:hypothetical protein M378DRAFT_173576 [Amanita muscaria Koide BX008]
MIGLFLHAANAPESVHELLSSIGLAVSVSTTKGQTMGMLWAFDNVDIYMRHATPTIGQSDSLIHLTSAIGVPLISINTGQLQCYTALQNRASLRPDSATRRAPVSPEHLLVLHDEPEADRSGLRRRERFYVYKFLQDLIGYGPNHFRKFATDLEQPETVEQIPITKTEYIPQHL